MNPKRLARYNERRCREYMLVTVGSDLVLRDAATVRGIRTLRCYWQPRHSKHLSMHQLAAMSAGIGGW